MAPEDADCSMKAIDSKGVARDLPKMQNQINKYLDGFHVCSDQEYAMYTRVFLGIDGDDEDLENFLVLPKALMLSEAMGHLYKKMLQVPHTSMIGVLLNSHEHIHTENLQQFILAQLTAFDWQHWALKGLPPWEKLVLIGFHCPQFGMASKKGSPQRVQSSIHYPCRSCQRPGGSCSSPSSYGLESDGISVMFQLTSHFC